MMEEQDKLTLIQYRLDQAKETIDEVNRLIEAELLKVAVSRIYYGIFYCLTAFNRLPITDYRSPRQ
jgi:uncharacterized protein (UPF0332 family)